MQDILRYNLIPLAPFEFLCVNKWYRNIAVNNLHRAHASYSAKNHEKFWIIIKLLHDNNRMDKIAEFTALNVDLTNT